VLKSAWPTVEAAKSVLLVPLPVSRYVHTYRQEAVAAAAVVATGTGKEVTRERERERESARAKREIRDEGNLLPARQEDSCASFGFIHLLHVRDIGERCTERTSERFI